MNDSRRYEWLNEKSERISLVAVAMRLANCGLREAQDIVMAVQADVSAKPRVGRPKGSKNKAETTVPILTPPVE